MSAADKMDKLLPVVTERCTGHCCRSFPLSIDMQASAVEVMAQLKAGPGGGRGSYLDAEYVLDMIIPIQGPRLEGLPQHAFTCRHFDGDNCTAYEARPKLCREHGISGSCDHRDKGCTFVVERPKLERDTEKWVCGDVVSRIETATTE